MAEGQPKSIASCELKGKDGRPKNCPENTSSILCSACTEDPKVLWTRPSNQLPLLYALIKRFDMTTEKAVKIEQIVIGILNNGNPQNNSSK